MANEEYLKILRRGSECWNKWLRAEMQHRASRTGVYVNAARLELRAGRLDFTLAKLANAKLSKVELIGADLWGADLRGADLRRATLFAAQLQGADLVGSDLRGADLRAANLSGAILRKADLSGCIMGLTHLGDNDFENVKGLETVMHDGPSTIGLDTIYRARGAIPEVFLRGVGVSDDFIALIRSLPGSIQFYSCFISYSSRDQELAQRIHADLQGRGIRCWFAPEDLKIGAELRPSFDEAIRLHDKLLILLSKDSIESRWIEDEVEAALEKERQQKRTVLFPVRLDDAVLETDRAWAAKIRRTRNIGDFRDWKKHNSYNRAFKRLLRDLKV